MFVLSFSTASLDLCANLLPYMYVSANLFRDGCINSILSYLWLCSLVKCFVGEVFVYLDQGGQESYKFSIGAREM